MKVFYLLALVSLLGLNACESEVEAPSSDVILPLKVGNMWVYEETNYDTLGTLVRTKADTMSVVGEVTIGSDHWYVFKTWGGDTISVRNKSNGLYFFQNGKETFEYLYPCKPGDELIIKADSTEYYVSQQIQNVETINSSIAVPAGTFPCVKYVDRFRDYITSTGELLYEDYHAVTYMAPNIGIVQLHGFGKTYGGNTYLGAQVTLKSYTLN